MIKYNFCFIIFIFKYKYKVNIIFEAVQNLLKPSYFDENCVYVHIPGIIVLCKLFTMLSHI